MTRTATSVAVSALAACLLIICLSTATSARVLSSLPDPSSIDTSSLPPACIDAGLALQSGCEKVISSAQSLCPDCGVGDVDNGAVQEFLNDPANTPSDACCKAATDFNAAKCNCNENVLTMVKSYTNNDLSLYQQIASALASTCGFTLKFGSPCS
ncbi:hypothetical protein FOA52_010547 [Chlamydomonas sp. UWO 241]|nr:hypothetical protein FOA52_010547 [Chlamydomonas sp. UWO 241]